MRYWSAYLTGYVILTADGASPERMINLAMQRGVAIWDIRWIGDQRLLMKVKAQDFFVLRHIARAAGYRLKILAKRGWPFVFGHMRHRRVFWAGALFFLLSLYFAGSFIWIVEVQMPETSRYLSQTGVLSEAASLGLRPGAWKPRLNPNDLARDLACRLPNVAWVSIHLKGTRARLEVVERNLPEQHTEAAHIVASKDGIVEEVLVLRGEPRVRPGDLVRQGQVLISGIVSEGPGPSVNLVQANGVVRARVWYECYASVPTVEERETVVGPKSSSFSLSTGSRSFHLWGPETPPFEFFTQEEKTSGSLGWGSYRIPWRLVTVTYQQVRKEEIRRSVQQAGEESARQAEEMLADQIPERASVISQQVERVYGNGKNEVVVRAVAETVEDIGSVFSLGAS